MTSAESLTTESNVKKSSDSSFMWSGEQMAVNRESCVISIHPNGPVLYSKDLRIKRQSKQMLFLRSITWTDGIALDHIIYYYLYVCFLILIRNRHYRLYVLYPRVELCWVCSYMLILNCKEKRKKVLYTFYMDNLLDLLFMFEHYFLFNEFISVNTEPLTMCYIF